MDAPEIAAMFRLQGAIPSWAIRITAGRNIFPVCNCLASLSLRCLWKSLALKCATKIWGQQCGLLSRHHGARIGGRNQAGGLARPGSRPQSPTRPAAQVGGGG
eukprot:scaffold150195_cov23-Tisochrysis_lutea.AAC.1